MMRLVVKLFVFATIVFVAHGIAVAQVPTLSHTGPYALVPGKATSVTFHGDGLLDAWEIEGEVEILS